MIYICRKANDDTAYKVGISANVEKRVRQIAAQYDTDIDLMCTLVGGRAEESALQTLMAQHRIEGEWFKPNAILGALIEDNASGDPIRFLRGKHISKNPNSADQVIARNLLRRLMQSISVDHGKAALLNEAYNRLKAINGKWKHRRVRAIYQFEARRIELFEILEMAEAAELNADELAEVLSDPLTAPDGDVRMGAVSAMFASDKEAGA